MASVIQSARKRTNENGLHLKNDEESMRFLKKLNQYYKRESPEISIKNLSKLTTCHDLEEFRAIFFSRRYALSQSYEDILYHSILMWRASYGILSLKKGPKIT